jgi:hypothetical protein
MKPVVTISGVILAGVAFALGAWTAMYRGWGNRMVTANIVNASGETLSSFAIDYQTCGVASSVTGGPLAKGAVRQIRYSVCGEGGYVVRVVFADGRVLEGREGYVEAGYVTTERVTADAVISSQSVY